MNIRTKALTLEEAERLRILLKFANIHLAEVKNHDNDKFPHILLRSTAEWVSASGNTTYEEFCTILKKRIDEENSNNNGLPRSGEEHIC